MSTYLSYYNDKVIGQLMERFQYKSIMQVPRLTKITLNMGVGGAATVGKDQIKHAINDLTLIAGQRAVQTFARKSIAGFKIRKGWPIGCKVTLRNRLMYEFLERLIIIVIPRVRDFRGYSIKSFDGSGNYNLGIREQIVFPEIDYDKIDCLRGLSISIATSALTNKEAWALLSAFNFPFKEKLDGKETG